MGEGEDSAPASEAAQSHVSLGCIVGAFGIAGGVRVRWWGDGPDGLLRAGRVLLARSEAEASPKSVKVCSVAPGRPGEVRMRLDGVSDRDAAESLRGCTVLVAASNLEQLPRGEHYWFELIGCRVWLPDESPLGTVREIWETGAHDVLVVEGDDRRRHLIPAVDAFVREIDVEERRIRIEPIPGLLDPI